MITSHRAGPTVVIGLGNPYRGDDGIGLAVLDCLRDSYDLPAEVLLIEGADWGMNFLPLVEEAQQLLLLDAIEMGEPPGTPIRLAGLEVPQHFDRKLSPHQADIRDLLQAADMRGRLPPDLVAIGVEPMPGRIGQRLSHEALMGIERAAAMAAEQLEAWGHAVHEKGAPV